MMTIVVHRHGLFMTQIITLLLIKCMELWLFFGANVLEKEMLYFIKILLDEEAENTSFHKISLANGPPSMQKPREWEIETIAYVLVKWLKYSFD